MFKKNVGHLQGSFFGTVDRLLGESQKKAFLESRERWFYDLVFRRIDERFFAPLYSEGNSRPNAPINCMVGALILQIFDNLTVEQLKTLKLKTDMQPCDSLQVESNIRSYSRIQLLIEVLFRLERILSDEDKASFAEVFAPYAGKTSGQYVYRIGLRGDRYRPGFRGTLHDGG